KTLAVASNHDHQNIELGREICRAGQVLGDDRTELTKATACNSHRAIGPQRDGAIRSNKVFALNTLRSLRQSDDLDNQYVRRLDDISGSHRRHTACTVWTSLVVSRFGLRSLLLGLGLQRLRLARGFPQFVGLAVR